MFLGTGNTSSDGAFKPQFLTDQELKHLILEAADGFLFIVACDAPARILYLSDSATAVLNQPHAEWTHQSFYDLVHADDIEKVREQLQGQDSSTSGRILDLKTGTVKKETHQVIFSAYRMVLLALYEVSYLLRHRILLINNLFFSRLCEAQWAQDELLSAVCGWVMRRLTQSLWAIDNFFACVTAHHWVRLPMGSSTWWFIARATSKAGHSLALSRRPEKA